MNFLRKLSGLQLWGIIIAVIAAVAFGDTLTKRHDPTISTNYTPTQEVSQEREVPAAAEEPAEKTYVVRESEGYIAVFESGGSLPVLKVMVAVDSLPQEDRLLLKEGVGFDDYAAMVAFLENYE